MDFGARLAELRKGRGFPQLDPADQAGLSRRMLAYYEGQSEHPPNTHLPGVARALGLTTDELLGLVASLPTHVAWTANASATAEERPGQHQERQPLSGMGLRRGGELCGASLRSGAAVLPEEESRSQQRGGHQGGGAQAGARLLSHAQERRAV